MTISVEQAHPTGGYILSAMVKGLPGEGARRLERRYFGYTLAEAKAKFRARVNDNGGLA